MEAISSWNGIIFMVILICHCTIISYLIQIMVLKRRSKRCVLINYHQAKNHYLTNLVLATTIFSGILLMMLLTFIVNTWNFYHQLRPQTIALMTINFMISAICNIGTIARANLNYEHQQSATLVTYQNYLKYRKYLKIK